MLADSIINSIDYKKDVDGLTDINKIKLISNDPYLNPCTSLGIIKLLDCYNIEIDNNPLQV